MIYLFASIVLSVILLLNFRLFPRFNVNTVQAISLNYLVCFATGYALLPGPVRRCGGTAPDVPFSLDFGQTWTWVALGIGVAFVVTFLLSGASTQRNGITATSLANNLSLVIPVCVSLFVLGGGGRAFDGWNYLGLVLAVVAVGLSTYKKSAPDEPKTAKTSPLVALLPVAVFLMYGFTNTMINVMNVRYIAKGASPVVVTLTMVVGAIAAGTLLFGYRLIRGIDRVEKQNLIGAVTLGIPNFLSFYTLVLALSAFKGNGAFVYPLYNIGVILLAAAVAALFFREKLLTVNKIGLALAVIAIGLISWQELF
ncbi:EamA/RhaT family transporter [Fibrella aquatilis]|uniref:EamA/RhaT family transporter n=1 Tax=Fibrella aquatilis TaxID=2817059 RepID=A0A939GAH8_9BACT|nr:EamA/RhaT family transporter [Fibrella aquatilis]MBO0932778.1 EamA/RhaT family transporter [Fibrella aquatilis]